MPSPKTISELLCIYNEATQLPPAKRADYISARRGDVARWSNPAPQPSAVEQAVKDVYDYSVAGETLAYPLAIEAYGAHHEQARALLAVGRAARLMTEKVGPSEAAEQASAEYGVPTAAIIERVQERSHLYYESVGAAIARAR